jgi:hypothetical protein
MNKEKKHIDIQLKPIKIESKGFLINEPDNFDQKPTDAYVEFHVNYNINRDKEHLSTIFIVSIFDGEKTKNKYSEIKTSFVYYVGGMRQFPMDGKEMKIPGMLMEYIIDSCISMIRGVLFEKWSGTYLSDIILPQIDPRKLKPRTTFK